MMRAAVFLTALVLCLSIIGAAGLYAGSVRQEGDPGPASSAPSSQYAAE